VVFDKEKNTSILCLQSFTKSNGTAPTDAGEVTEIEDTDKIDILRLPQEEIHPAIIDQTNHDDPGRADDSMIHGCIRKSGAGGVLYHGHTGSKFEETTSLPYDTNTTGQKNRQGCRSLPAAGADTGHIHTAPDEDANTNTQTDALDNRNQNLDSQNQAL
jgi:hypothetical protein